MSPSHSSPQPLNWRRVGAMSSSLSLHVLAAALALLAVLKPANDPLQLPKPPLDMQVEIVLQPPLPAIPEQAETPPDAAPVVRVTRSIETQPAEPAIDDQTEAVADPIDTRVAIVASSIEPLPTPTIAEPVASSGATYENVRLPGYPAIARKHGLHGETVLRVLVSVSGSAERIDVSRSSGHRILDRAAIASVRTWRFKPATENGIAIPSWVEVPVAFRLDAR